MKIKLSKEQTTAFDHLTETNGINRVLYGGQAGGGKSFLICLWQIHQRLTYPGTRGYIGREVLKRLKESVLVTFFDVARSLGVEYKYNDVKSHIDFPNGSRIVLLDLFLKPSDANLDSLGSVEFTDGAIEEGIQVDHSVADILKSRTRYKLDEYSLEPKQLITCNPGDGWIKDEIIIPHFEERLRPDTRFVNATLESNPNAKFVKQYRENLESMTDEFHKSRLLHGDWFSQPKTGGEFYKEFDEQRNTRPIPYDPAKPLHITFDFNVNPYMTLLVHQMDGQSLFQIDELCLPDPNNTTPLICREFKRKYQTHSSGLFVYGDPAGKHKDTRSEKGHNDYDIIKKELEQFHPQIRIRKSAPSVVMRGNFINELFAGRIENCSFNIHNECEKTIKDYNFTKQSSDGTKHKRKIKNARTGVTYEEFGHCSDANDYLITYVFSDEFKRYSTGGREIVRTLPTQTRKIW